MKDDKREKHLKSYSLDQMIQRKRPRAAWDHLAVPTNTVEELKHACSHSAPGKNHRILLTGAGSENKALAAEVIATQLGMDFYRIDLSAVVNKYIGETEKNLRRVFAAAEEGGAILFFDEADALLGKRSEVKDSHDRYANLDIESLLQQLEQFHGLAILATNQPKDLHAALFRHFNHAIDIP